MSSTPDDHASDAESLSTTEDPRATTRAPVRSRVAALTKAYTRVTSRPSDSNYGMSEGLRHMCALVVGIDEYPHIRKLKGAVADAHAVRDFLLAKDCMELSPDRIKVLVNEQATRDAIIRAIQDLAHFPDEMVVHHCLIYFAGHGTTGWASEDKWAGGGRDEPIPMLCPYDCFAPCEGGMVQPIPGKTIGTLLTELEGVIGQDTITMILDCCHTGPGASTDNRGIGPVRGSGANPAWSSRGISYDGTVPADLDQTIFNASTRELHPTVAFPLRSSLASSFLGTGSHVLLTACGVGEEAWEKDGQGLFTAGLLALLKNLYALRNVTYYDVINLFPPLAHQNPQCEARNPHRWLFSYGSRPNSVRAEHLHGDVFQVDAGVARGVTPRSRFVTDHRDMTEEFYYELTLAANEVTPFTATAMAIPTEQKNGHLPYPTVKYLLPALYLPGELAVFVDPTSPYQALRNQDWHWASADLGSYTIVERKEDADLDLCAESDQVTLKHLFRPTLPAQHVPTHIPYRLLNPPVQRLERFLVNAAIYYWHLRRMGNMPQDNVQLEFLEQEQWWDKEARYHLQQRGDDLAEDGRISHLRRDRVYGLKITNNSRYDLYVSLFYFNHRDFSIRPHYLPATSRKHDARLLRRGTSLTLVPQLPSDVWLREDDDHANGMAVDDTDPHVFQEVGCLKVFLTTEWVHMTDIEVESPFGTQEHFGEMLEPYEGDADFVPTVKLAAAAWV